MNPSKGIALNVADIYDFARFVKSGEFKTDLPATMEFESGVSVERSCSADVKK